jgi:hypothetical protein
MPIATKAVLNQILLLRLHRQNPFDLNEKHHRTGVIGANNELDYTAFK